MTEPPDPEVVDGPGPDAFRGVTRLERVLLPFLREPTLWPVFAVLLIHVVVLVSPLMVWVWREGHGGALSGLLLLGVGSAFGVFLEVRERGGARLLTALIAGTWLLCAIAAWAGVLLDLL